MRQGYMCSSTICQSIFYPKANCPALLALWQIFNPRAVVPGPILVPGASGLKHVIEPNSGKVLAGIQLINN